MIDKISRNAPCPCGSGKKYKNCCMQSASSKKSESAFRGQFRFEPGSYGSTVAFVPSIACLQERQNEVWDYYFVLVKPQHLHAQELDAAAEAIMDLETAFHQRELTGSDITVAENLRAQGYLSVNDFRIATDERYDTEADGDVGFRPVGDIGF
ncbi:MAG: SEC-C metal-binding domain-containing protein [candidate division KSB1 bacterium]|nr:SEC-C metal-binding domain-containing protein [candidate division KSB1 bacterium]MDZ7304990.1 SEC-C metal-binding domain-containing protein [candidate division KSB1 bacterium]MDZ7314033.1 SEC-C metal-binding domain-containing protein [candidate division KSB1 bacterium]